MCKRSLTFPGESPFPGLGNGQEAARARGFMFWGIFCIPENALLGKALINTLSPRCQRMRRLKKSLIVSKQAVIVLSLLWLMHLSNPCLK